MNQRHKTSILIISIFMISLIPLPLHTYAAGSFDDIEKDLALLDKYYETKQ